MPNTLCVSRFLTWTDNQPQELTFPDLRALVIGLALNKHGYADDKKKTPAFSPVSYHPNTTRGSANVAYVHLYAADYDALSEEGFERVLEFLTQSGLAYALYSTFSHRDASERKNASPDKKVQTYSFRLLIPLQEAVPAKRWAYVWQALTQRLPKMPDKSCKDAARLYGLPYTNNPQDAFTEACLDGKAWDVPEVDTTAPLHGQAFVQGSGRPLISAAVWDADSEVREWVQYLSRYKADPTEGWVYALMKCVRDGTPFADKSMGRHETLLTLTMRMEKRWPFVEVDALAAVFARSLRAIQITEEPGLDVGQRLEEITRLLQGARDKREAAAIPAPAVVRTGPRTWDDDTPYTDAELAGIAQMQGVDGLADLARRWLVGKGDSYYILTHAGYTPAFLASEFPAMRRRLEAAASAGVELRTGGTKPRAKTLPELFGEYGSKVNNVIVSYAATFAKLTVAPDGKTTMVEPAAGVRAELGRGAYDAGVQKWLESLGGGEKLLDWLASVPRLSEPLAALYLSGPSGIGKNLLTLSLARMFYQGGPVQLSTVLGDQKYQNALVDCPIVVADEDMPPTATFENVCEFIGTTSRGLKRKYMPDATIEGATRLLLTANKTTMMGFATQKKAYTKHQFAAVAHRIFHVHLDDEQGAKVTALLQAMPEHLTWLETDAVAKHVLWLAETRRVQRDGRFLVSGNFSEMLDMFVDTNPLLSRIVEWCARYLLNPGQVENNAKNRGQIRIKNNTLVVPSILMHAAWRTYAGEDDTLSMRKPDMRVLVGALEALRDNDTGGIPLKHVYRLVADAQMIPKSGEGARVYNKYLCLLPGDDKTVAEIVGIDKQPPRSTN